MLNELTKEQLIEYFMDKFYVNPRLVEVNLMSQKKKAEQVRDVDAKENPLFQERGFDVMRVGEGSLMEMKSQLMMHPDPFKMTSYKREAAKL